MPLICESSAAIPSWSASSAWVTAMPSAPSAAKPSTSLRAAWTLNVAGTAM